MLYVYICKIVTYKKYNRIEYQYVRYYTIKSNYIQIIFKLYSIIFFEIFLIRKFLFWMKLRYGIMFLSHTRTNIEIIQSWNHISRYKTLLSSQYANWCSFFKMEIITGVSPIPHSQIEFDTDEKQWNFTFTKQSK